MQAQLHLWLMQAKARYNYLYSYSASLLFKATPCYLALPLFSFAVI
jgi:hypothetical protein